MSKNNSIPLGCIGNKKTELKLLLPIIEPQINNKTIFVEPFCGSCVVSFAVYKNNKNIEFHVNDIDEIRIQFYKNINTVSTFGLDIKNGHEIIYWPNGNKLRDCYYVNGELDGKYLEWYSNGKIMISCNYKNGKLDGNYEDRLKNGKIRVVCKYENDKVIGNKISILFKRLLNPL